MTVAEVWLPPDPELGEAAFPEPMPEAVKMAYARAREEIEASRVLAERASGRVRELFPKWSVHAKAFGDSPGWGIVKEAAARKADLIALGSHGRSALEKLFLGSVAQKVAAEAHCSVRIARPRKHAHPSLKVLVAVDGSIDSQAAVQAVAKRNWPVAEFRVLTVIDPKMETAAAWPSLSADQWVQPQDRNTDAWVGRMAEHSAKQLREAGLKVETHVFDRDPKQVLLREVENGPADCIFLGARGLHHGKQLFFGTLASAVAGRAHCSVEIIRSQ